jgi:hypothetical protein
VMRNYRRFERGLVIDGGEVKDGEEMGRNS